MSKMYEAKYSQYITRSVSKFATSQEIKDQCVMIKKEVGYTGCGAPLFYDAQSGEMYVDNTDAHFYIQGQTGSKKSRVIETNIIYSIINAGENAVISDPKGEAYRRTGYMAKAKGYKVMVLNFRDVSRSAGWNPLGLSYNFYERGNISEAEQAINDFTQAVMGHSMEVTADCFWPENAQLLLNFCIQLMLDSVPKEYYNLMNVIQLANECNVPILREMLKLMDQTTSAAICMHSIVDLIADRTISCIYSTLKQSIRPFIQNNSLLELLCSNDVNFKDLVNEKTIIYVIYPDEKESLSFLISLFFDQCYKYLIDYSARNRDAMLKKRVNFVLDEFSNLPQINNFQNCISEARGHNIRYFIFSQSYSQLVNKYKENADTILSNCDWILFPSKEFEFLSKLSNLCGKEYDYYGVEHSLVDVCEMQHLKKYQDGAEALILKSGQYPFITKLPDYEYIDVFERYPDADPSTIKRRRKPAFISFDEWSDGIAEGSFKFPFPKKSKAS